MTRDWHAAHLVIVAHGLHRHAQHLVSQRVAARVHHLLDDVDDHVDLLDAAVPEHVGVGGGVVRQVGAVAGLQGDTLSRHAAGLYIAWLGVDKNKLKSKCSDGLSLRVRVLTWEDALVFAGLVSPVVVHDPPPGRLQLPLGEGEAAGLRLGDCAAAVERGAEHLADLGRVEPRPRLGAEVEIEVDCFEEALVTPGNCQ